MLHFIDPVLPVLMGPSGLHPATGFYDSHQAVFFLAGNPSVTVIEQRPDVLAVLDSDVLDLIHRRFSRPANALVLLGDGNKPSIRITLSPPKGKIPLNKLWLCSDYNSQDWQRVHGLNKVPALNYDLFLISETALVCTYRLNPPAVLVETLKYLGNFSK